VLPAALIDADDLQPLIKDWLSWSVDRSFEDRIDLLAGNKRDIESLREFARARADDAVEAMRSGAMRLETAEQSLAREAHAGSRLVDTERFVDMRREVAEIQRALHDDASSARTFGRMSDDFHRQARSIGSKVDALHRERDIRIDHLGRIAAAAGMISVMDELRTSEAEIRSAAARGDHHAALELTFASAAVALANGALAIPNRFGLLAGVSLDLMAPRAAKELGKRFGSLVDEWGFDQMNRFAHFLHDRDLAPTPRFPRPIED
jgi:hypothetical protein